MSEIYRVSRPDVPPGELVDIEAELPDDFVLMHRCATFTPSGSGELVMFAVPHDRDFVRKGTRIHIVARNVGAIPMTFEAWILGREGAAPAASSEPPDDRPPRDVVIVDRDYEAPFVPVRLAERIAHVYFATPTRGETMLPFTSSITQTREILNAAGIGLTFMLLPPGGAIQNARNRLAARMLRHPEATHLLFVDSDIGWNPHDIVRMVLADKDVIGGAYPLKTIDWTRVRAAVMDRKHNLAEWCSPLIVNLLYSPEGDLTIDGDAIEATELATGFMLIKRGVLEHMIAKGPELRYASKLDGEAPEIQYALFECVRHGLDWVSEDYEFSRRWRALGGRCWVDARARFEHVGLMAFRSASLAEILGLDDEPAAGELAAAPAVESAAAS